MDKLNISGIQYDIVWENIDANIKIIDPLAENWSKNIVEITKSFKSAN
jgi:hypothetical protein